MQGIVDNTLALHGMTMGFEATRILETPAAAPPTFRPTAAFEVAVRNTALGSPVLNRYSFEFAK